MPVPAFRRFIKRLIRIRYLMMCRSPPKHLSLTVQRRRNAFVRLATEMYGACRQGVAIAANDRAPLSVPGR